MDKKNRVIVRIGGKEYAMRGTEPEEYIHKVAICVDKKMAEISSKQPPLSTSMLAILTAVNLADDLIQQREANKHLQKENEDLKRELDRIKSTLKPVDRERVNIYDMPQKGRRQG